MRYTASMGALSLPACRRHVRGIAVGLGIVCGLVLARALGVAGEDAVFARLCNSGPYALSQSAGIAGWIAVIYLMAVKPG